MGLGKEDYNKFAHEFVAGGNERGFNLPGVLEAPNIAIPGLFASTFTKPGLELPALSANATLTRLRRRSTAATGS